MYQIGDRVEIVAGEYAGLGGEIVAVYPDEYEVLVGGYRLPVVARDLAPELRLVAQEALDELQRLGGSTQVIARLMAALHR
jgi:ribosomal protein L24